MKRREVAGAKVQGSPFTRRAPAALGATRPGTQRGFVAVGQTPPGSSGLARDRAADLTLMFALLIAAAVAGGSAYETFVLLPAWDVGTPGGSAAGGGAGALSLGRALGQFWLACYTAGAASLLLALVFNWRWNWRRAMVLLALLGFVTLRAWMYFSLRQDVDSLLSVAGGPPAAAGLVDHVAQWSAHHRWREVIDGLVAASLAMAFAVPARILSKTVARAAGIHRRASRESPR